MSEICALCNEAVVEEVVEEGSEERTYKAVGSPTEAALKVLVEKLGAIGGTGTR